MVSAVGGCSARTSSFQITDYREGGRPTRYQETFPEAYYALDEHGNVDIILRRSTPAENEPTQNITQVIHIRSVWRPIPGTTVAHATQINATVTYHIISGRMGVTFEGAGSAFYRKSGREDTLSGTLDGAVLNPKRRLASSVDLFKRAEIAGEFSAAHNPRRVVRIINEMDRLFGPLKPYPTTSGR